MIVFGSVSKVISAFWPNLTELISAWPIVVSTCKTSGFAATVTPGFELELEVDSITCPTCPVTAVTTPSKGATIVAFPKLVCAVSS
ncbi:hypothetical protein SDC9_188022 [bioreactor metagenome]|uniref:Uncharacterized protein n=1 Tax=bioreactor metagenome TaxID=1076179 RepID=A0A645HWD1_9ZZZZ